MLHFEFFRKGSATNFSNTFWVRFLKKNISGYVQLTGQISFSDCLYLFRYWAIVVL